MAGGGAYLLGHTDREQRRLAGQAALIGPDTEALFRDAGLGPGMSVLDVGSGLGDVAILAGKLVSPGGRVLGIERSTKALRSPGNAPRRCRTSTSDSSSRTSTPTSRSKRSTRSWADSCSRI